MIFLTWSEIKFNSINMGIFFLIVISTNFWCKSGGVQINMADRLRLNASSREFTVLISYNFEDSCILLFFWSNPLSSWFNELGWRTAGVVLTLCPSNRSQLEEKVKNETNHTPNKKEDWWLKNLNFKYLARKLHVIKNHCQMLRLKHFPVLY